MLFWLLGYAVLCAGLCSRMAWSEGIYLPSG